MGCSNSSEVVENPKKNPITIEKKQILEERAATVIKQIPERGESFIIGSISENEQIFANVKLESLSINKMSIPPGLTCHNFCSMLEFQKGKYFIAGGISFDLTKISNNCFIYSSEKHSIEVVQPMKQPRYTHISLMYEEDILIIGGRFYGDDSKAILKSCEKYSIKTQEWMTLPDLNVSRCTAFGLIWNEKVYVFGGYTGPFERSTKIEYLKPGVNNKWTLLDIQLYRGIEGAIILPTNNNQFTIFGGLTNAGATDSVTSINLKDETINFKAKLKQKRSLYKSYYKSGKIFIFGGDDEFTSQIYNVSEQTSIVHQKQYPFPIDQFDNFGFSTSTVCVPFDQSIDLMKSASNHENDEVIYIFGTTQEPFVLEMNISIPKVEFHAVPINLKLYSHQGGVQIDHNNFILFGGIEEDSLSVVSSDTYGFDFKNKSVKKLANMNQKRYAFTQVATKNSNQKVQFIYVFGGATSNTEGKLVYLSVCERYSIASDKWEVLTPMPQKLISPMSLIFKNQIFVFGGTSQESNQRKLDIHHYSTHLNQWATIQSKMQFGLEAGSVLQISQNEFYIFGGRVETGDTNGIWSIFMKEKEGKKNKDPQFECIFQQKGQMSEPKSLHKIFKPKNQDFYVIFGGLKSPLSFYRSDSLKEENSDNLANMKQLFEESLSSLSQKSLKNYLILTEQ